jgi:hypothetical protein
VKTEEKRDKGPERARNPSVVAFLCRLRDTNENVATPRSDVGFVSGRKAGVVVKALQLLHALLRQRLCAQSVVV